MILIEPDTLKLCMCMLSESAITKQFKCSLGNGKGRHDFQSQIYKCHAVFNMHMYTSTQCGHVTKGWHWML